MSMIASWVPSARYIGFFTLVDNALFCDVVFSVSPLLEKVPGIGVIAEQL